MIHPRHAVVLAAALFAAAVLSIGINRIVVTDGHVAASTAHVTGKVDLAFKRLPPTRAIGQALS